MGHERWFRGQQDGQNRPFDWLTPARQHGLPWQRAQALYEQAVQQAPGAAQGRVQEIYLDLLASARQMARCPSPGKVTRAMRLQAERAGQRRRPHVSQLTGQPIAPGKVTLASYLAPAHEPAHAQRDESPVIDELALLAHGRAPAEPGIDPAFLARPALPVDRPAMYAARLEVAQDASSDWQQALQRERAGAPGDARLPAGTGEPLPPELRARMAAAFDHDFSHVRIHTDSASGNAAEQMKAHAVTQGSHVFFGHGEFAPGTPEGDRLLLHELTHVVQADQGRLPSRGGLSAPHDPHEREARSAESRLATVLRRVDAGELALPASVPSRSASPMSARTLSRDADASAPSAPAKTGPNTSEDALLGDLPTVAAAPQAPAIGPEQPQPLQPQTSPVPQSENGAAPVAAPAAENAPAPASAPASAPAMREAPVGPVPVGPAVAPPPTLSSAAEWAARAREEGGSQAARIADAAGSAVSRVRATAAAEAARTSAAFAGARARLEADAATTRAEIQARVEAARTAIESRLTALSAQLDVDFAAREQTARGAVEAARTQLADGVEAEAQRAITESQARAERALALADGEGTGGEAPLAAGQRDIARRVANEVAAQCRQTGADAAAEVRKAGATQISGVDAHLEGVLDTLAQARERARTKLDTMRSESLSGLDEKAAEASAEIDERVAEASATLTTRERELTGWITSQTETEAAAIEARAAELTGPMDQNFAALTSAYDQAQAELDAALAEAPDAPAETVAEVNAGVSAELARMWQEHAAPQIAQAEQAATTLASHGDAVSEGFTSAVTEAETSSRQAVEEQSAQLRSVGARFSEACTAAETQAGDAAQQGLAGELAEADRAVEAHQAELDAAVTEALGGLRSAVDAQLAWEDQQIAAASERISAGQTQAASDYQSAKDEARARDQGEQTASRGWLGDLWNFFDDLAQRTLEWFQEKLGRVWGNIIGGILGAIIYVVGVVVCAAAWLGAQVLNLIWGFIWGETLIPGYGGGVFAFIADVIAGVLVYGDLRDIFKYWIWRPLWGEGPWWLNLLMGAVALLGVIPLFGDGLKALIKALKAGSKTALKWLAKLVGDELAERIARTLGEEAAERIARRLTEELGEEAAGKLIRELGAEAAEELLERLGKDTLAKLAQELSGETIKRLADELGERALKKLAEELSGTAIEKIAGDLGKEAIEKLLRTVGGATIEELNTHLGKDAVLKLLDGLRGVTIKEYFDALGGPALKNLARDLDGYAVKELMDALGAPTLRTLADDLGGAAVKQLFDELGEETLKKLTNELGGTAIKELFDGLGKETLQKLATELGGTAIKQLSDGLTPAILKKLSNDLGGTAIKQLADDLTPDILKKLATDLDGAVVQRLATELGAPALKELAEKLSPTMIRDLVDALGKDLLLRLKTSLGVDGLKQITDAITPAQLKAFVDEIGEQGIQEFGAKALAEVGRHLSPTELMELLTSPGTTMAFLRSFCEQGGAGTALRSAIGHFGSAADLGKVLAFAELRGMPAATLQTFLDQCTRLGWKKIPQLGEFFRHVGGSGSWTDAMNWAEMFHGVGNRFRLKPEVPGSQVGGAVTNTTRVGATDVVTTTNDLAHWKAGHTFEEYALTPGNAGRGPFSSMWPAGTADAAILSDMAGVLADGAMLPVVAQAAASGRATVTISGYFVGLTKIGGDVRLVQFFPDPGNPSIPRAVARGIVQLFESM